MSRLSDIRRLYATATPPPAPQVSVPAVRPSDAGPPAARSQPERPLSPTDPNSPEWQAWMRRSGRRQMRPIRGSFSRGREEAQTHAPQPLFGEVIEYSADGQAADRTGALLRLAARQHAERAARQHAREAHELAGSDYLPCGSRM